MGRLRPASMEALEPLAAALPPAAFKPADETYLSEPRNRHSAANGVVIAPSGAAEASLVIRHCCEHRIPVVPFGGGTGLVSGQIGIGIPAPVILSTERMDRIESVDAEENVLVAGAGCTLESVRSAAEREGRQFPLSIAARGSSQIGGNLATNAGGIHVLRYGSMRELCLGVEAVLPDGGIWNGMSSLRKDNAGYDLKQLLIGSEGTLGLLTAASLKIFPRLRDSAAAVLAVRNPAAAVSLLSLFRERFGSLLSAFELMSGTGLEFLAEAFPEARLPFERIPGWTVLAEAAAESDCGVAAMLEQAAADGMESGLVADGVAARSEKHAAEFWQMREMIPEANRRIGAVASHDVSVPVTAIPEFIRRADAAVRDLGDFRINCFGHVGDGNLHYNVFPPCGLAAAECAAADVTGKVHALVREFGGSIAAEHGIGRTKAAEFASSGDKELLKAMRRIKNALDPAGIMNPGAVLTG